MSIQVEIPSQFHRALLVNRGQKIQDLQSKYHVLIRFPERRFGTGMIRTSLSIEKLEIQILFRSLC